MKVTTENAHKEFVAAYKKDHKVLNLQIKQEFLTQILNGTKKQEIREIKPTTERKYVVLGKDGYPEEDKERYIEVMEPIEVAVKITENGLGIVYEDGQILPVYMAKNDDGEEFEAVMVDGVEFELVRAHDENGKDLLDEDGLPVMAIAYYDNLCSCVPIKYDAINFYVGNKPDTDHALVEVIGTRVDFVVDEDDKPMWYEVDGERYYEEVITFELGEKICEYKA